MFLLEMWLVLKNVVSMAKLFLFDSSGLRKARKPSQVALSATNQSS